LDSKGTPNPNNGKKWVTFTYLGNGARNITKLSKNANIKTAFKNQKHNRKTCAET
jgi:hypothetical protein